jgi:hypothetical protein
MDGGVAGGSARREHQRRVWKRDEDARAKWGERLGGFVLALTVEPASTSAWAIGAAGEEKLAASLAEVEGLQILNDRRAPGTRGNIDHIVVAPAGVFVVDAKNHSGQVDIKDRGGLLRSDPRLYVGRRDCSRLADGLGWQIEAVRSAVAKSDVEAVPPVTPVLCFVSATWPVFFAPESYRGVRLESVKSLRKLVVSRDELEVAMIDRVRRTLAKALPSK